MTKEELFHEIEWMDPGDSMTITAGTADDWDYTVERPPLNHAGSRRASQPAARGAT